MTNIPSTSETLINSVLKKKIVTMNELMKTLKAKYRMRVFRELKKINYITSCSHNAKFYSLKRIARFNRQGLWFYNSVLFSRHGTLVNSVEFFVNESDNGYTASELEKVLKIKVDDVLLILIKNQKIVREKISGVYVYFSKNYMINKQQDLNRKDSFHSYNTKLKSEISMNELKASLVIFFSLLDEKQRRFYAGLESLKVGHGGDKYIAEILGLNEKTVAKGRKELLAQKIEVDSIRKKGGGRKELKKKSQNS